MELAQLIGRPYQLPSEPPISFDCYSLVAYVRENFFGLPTPAPYDISTVTKDEAGRAIVAVRSMNMWEVVKQGKFGDIVQMEKYHIGVFVAGGVMHAWRTNRSGSVVLTNFRVVDRLFSMCDFLRLIER